METSWELKNKYAFYGINFTFQYFIHVNYFVCTYGKDRPDKSSFQFQDIFMSILLKYYYYTVF